MIKSYFAVVFLMEFGYRYNSIYKYLKKSGVRICKVFCLFKFGFLNYLIIGYFIVLIK